MGASPGAADRVRHKLRAASFKKHGKDLHNLLSAFDTNQDGKLPVAQISEGVQELLPGVVAPNELEILLGTASSEPVDYRSFFEFTPVLDYVSPVSPVSPAASTQRAGGGAAAPAAAPLLLPMSGANASGTPLTGASTQKTTITFRAESSSSSSSGGGSGRS